MKKLALIVFVFGLFWSSAFAFEMDAALLKGPVYDEMDLLSLQAKQDIAAAISKTYDLTSIKEKIIIIPTTKPDKAEEFGKKIYQRWSELEYVGERGLILLASILDGQFVIISGKSVEKALNKSAIDQICWKSTKSIIEGNISTGLIVATETIRQLLSGKKIVDEVAGPNLTAILTSHLPVIVIAALLILIISEGLVEAFIALTAGLFGLLFFGIMGIFWGVVIGLLLRYRRAY